MTTTAMPTVSGRALHRPINATIRAISAAELQVCVFICAGDHARCVEVA
jgi:hypothetical protein